MELELTFVPAGLCTADGEVRQRRREHLQHRLLNVAAQQLRRSSARSLQSSLTTSTPMLGQLSACPRLQTSFVQR